MERRLSSLEFLLSVVTSLLLTCCVALIVVSWIHLKPGGAIEPTVLSARMAITDGAVFSAELQNASSLQFKALAFDIQQLVSEAFHHSELRLDFKSCQVLYFSQGSVVVTFDLWFSHLINVKEAEQQLGAGLQEVGATGLVIDRNSIQITEKQDETTVAPTSTKPTTEKQDETTVAPTSTKPTTAACPPHQISCADRLTCIPINQLCDGLDDCPDASDEDAARCVTVCDGQFLLSDLSGSFGSSDASETYASSSFCRWIIRVDGGLSVQINFQQFETEENIDTLQLYEGVGADKHLIAELSGSTPPGTMWLLTDQSTVEFISDAVNNLSGFKAVYSAANLSHLSDEEKLSCTFEQGMCFWRQQDDDDGDWIRTSGSTFPPLSGPSFDHTLRNSSGFYIVTPLSPGQWLKSIRIHSLPLLPSNRSMCLGFWFHMFGDDVHRLRVLLSQPAITTVFQRDGNYGDNWNYGQVTINLTSETTVVFEALKKRGFTNDIALDDITLTSDPCGPAPPEPTNVPAATTLPPLPANCGGPFDLWEPNSTFSSPNYPQSYGNKAECLWTLHAADGQNIQLHFLDFDVEATYDVVEVRDGAGPNSTLLAVLTGSNGPAHELFSTTNQMTVWFFTDSSGHGRGFRAHFTSGFHLGAPACGVRQVTNDTTQTDQSADRKRGEGEVRVVGGSVAVKGAWPWMVSLNWRGRHVCGASLIGREWLLTAAHCVYGKNVHLQWWSVVLGLHSQSDSNSVDVESRQVDDIIINRRYNRRSKQADIAMMHLRTPVNFTQFIQPLCLPAEGHEVTAGSTCWIAGWGRSAEQGPLPDVLQEAQVPVVDQDQCQIRLPEYTITSEMLCAGYLEGGVDSCQGDSGGPLVCLDRGRWTLIGVTSFGVGCGRPQRPGVYARVSAFSSWITQTRSSSPNSCC